MPCPGDLPNPSVEPRSLALQADSLLSEPPGKPPPLFFTFGSGKTINNKIRSVISTTLVLFCIYFAATVLHGLMARVPLC